MGDPTTIKEVGNLREFEWNGEDNFKVLQIIWSSDITQAKRMIKMRVTDVAVIKLINGWLRLCVIGRLDLIICCEIDGIFLEIHYLF